MVPVVDGQFYYQNASVPISPTPPYQDTMLYEVLFDFLVDNNCILDSQALVRCTDEREGNLFC